ncbi:hypothetical protein SUGI_0224020 [Cryptomeria japonica]|nr:hypothetical protein SUGI_0224020 [Cryptomeria japonica]
MRAVRHSREHPSFAISLPNPQLGTASIFPIRFLRLDWDGNLGMYTYSPDVEGNTWDMIYERFKNGEGIYGCGPPKKCGSLGVCPQPDGVKAWSPNCSPPKLPACSGINSASVDFYKLVGVEHFSKKYAAGIGKLTVVECKRRCLSDCKCAAFFYWQESSTCFLTELIYSAATWQHHASCLY